MSGRSGSKNARHARARMSANKRRGQSHRKFSPVPDARDVELEKEARRRVRKKNPRPLEPSWALKPGDK